MPDYRGKHFARVFEALATVTSYPTTKTKHEIQYYAAVPEREEDRAGMEPMEPSAVNTALINGQPLVAYNEDFGYVPFGMTDTGELAYGDDFLDSCHPKVPPEPEKPWPGFWYDFLSLIGIETETQRNYDRDFKEYSRLRKNADMIEKFREHRDDGYGEAELLLGDDGQEELQKSDGENGLFMEKPEVVFTDIEAAFDRVDEAVEEAQRPGSELDLQSVQKLQHQVEKALSRSDEHQLVELENAYAGKNHLEQHFDYSEETKALAAQPEVKEMVIRMLATQDRTFSKLVNGRPDDEIPKEQALAELTRKENYVGAFDAQQKQEFIEKVDKHLDNARENLMGMLDIARIPNVLDRKLSSIEQNQYRNACRAVLSQLTGEDVAEVLPGLQDESIRKYEKNLPVSSWPDGRADPVKDAGPAVPQETEKSRQGLAFLNERRKEAYETLADPEAPQEAVLNAIGEIGTISQKFADMSSAGIEADVLTKNGLSSMPKNAHKAAHIRTLVNEERIRALESVSADKPELFNKAVQEFTAQSGFANRLAGKSGNIKAVCEHLLKHRAPENANAEQLAEQAKSEAGFVKTVVQKANADKVRGPQNLALNRNKGGAENAMDAMKK